MLLGVPILFRFPEGRRWDATQTWAQRLGWPADKRVVIFHADDIGMCYGQSSGECLSKGLPLGRSHGACPGSNEMAAWCANTPNTTWTPPDFDQRMEVLPLGSVAQRDKVPGLIDPQGYLFRKCPESCVRPPPGEVAADSTSSPGGKWE